ncbi:MAG: Methionine--tRNA ligase [Mycoplasmataceae bacterium]|nr:MAG: Methionine--tRNA ligase [Mycoplasmataceae bacterium]
MNKSKNFYITTPIFYPNNQLHLGHAYTVTIADIIARYKKMQGYNVYFQTGSDEHGEKISKTANLNNLTPQQLVDKNVLLFKKLWKELNILEDHYFMRTSFSFHKEKVQWIFEELLLKGDIYLGKYKGNYCIVCEEYVLNSKKCPSCNSELKEISEEAYFLKINKYRDTLIKYYDNNPEFLSPKTSINELFQSFLRQEIPDLCITRNDLSWGVSVPNKPEMTIYVWFDALCNYLTSENGDKFFSQDNHDSSEIVQIIGKDILRFHAIYWIILLIALNRKIPNKLISHGWILNSGSKMSKSKGNVINPLNLLNDYSSDVLRAYFAGKITIYQDGLLDEELLESFYQNFFLNNLGNLFSRVCKMLDLYRNNVIPIFNESKNDLLIDYYEDCISFVKKYEEKMNVYQITSAFNEIQNLIDNSNRLISTISPWKLFSEKNFELLDESLVYIINGLKVIAFLLFPITPETSEKIFSHFDIKLKDFNFQNIYDFKNFENKKLQKLSSHLFN